jgi:uncharacterized alpha-E superfamily protein
MNQSQSQQSQPQHQPDDQPLLSRVADAVYWLARYVERAENIARYICVNMNLQLDLPMTPQQQWAPLINTTGDAKLFEERYGEATQDNVINFLAYDDEYHSSIASCLRFARENARSVRETITPEMWQQINSMYLRLQTNDTQPEPEYLLDAFREVSLGCNLLHGIAEATMSHNEAWNFLRLGQRLERADKTSRILDVKYFMLLPSLRDVGTPYDDLHWSAVLKSVSGFEMYRQRYGLIRPRDVVNFLVMDREFPRAIRYCIGSANVSLRRITGTPSDQYHYKSEELLGLLENELAFAKVDDILDRGLHEYLDTTQRKLNDIDNALRGDFLGTVAYDAGSQSHSQTTLSSTGTTA